MLTDKEIAEIEELFEKVDETTFTDEATRHLMVVIRSLIFDLKAARKVVGAVGRNLPYSTLSHEVVEAYKAYRGDK